MKCATLFSGGGGAELGLIQAGLEAIWAIEKDSAIASQFQINFPQTKMINDDIRNVNPEDLEPVDYLHASPPCQQYSSARRNAKEDCVEKDVGLEIAKFIEVIRPHFFSLENVPLYRFNSIFLSIIELLHKLNYWTHWGVYDACDYGVPQNRKRLILRASRTGFVAQILSQEKRGWKVAIADLIDDLPESELADWQQERIKGIRHRPLLMPRAGTNCKSCKPRQAHQPAPTVRALKKWRGTHWADVIMKDSVRRIIPEATARLMGFPGDYILPDGSLSQVILGNAVPPPMMKAIAKSFRMLQ